MNINYEHVKVIPAEKANEDHKREVWKVFNEYIGFNFVTTELVSYEQHCMWWETVFDKEYVYIIKYESTISGYIRLTKVRTNSKEMNEISIALKKEFQNTGIGSHAYKIFENEIRKKGISHIVAMSNIKNELSQNFFIKNDFEKTFVRFVKKL